MSEDERKRIGALSRAGKSKASIKQSVKAMQKAFSPVRQKGYKQPIGKCPHCKKEGGMNLLKRWHFDRCKTLL
jgi:hypothetical protein